MILEWIRKALNHRSAKKYWGQREPAKILPSVSAHNVIALLGKWIGEDSSPLEVITVRHDTHECFSVTRRFPGGAA